jgi:DivIVA domain-containing protein
VIWLALLVAVVIAVITAAAVLGRVDGSLADATTTMSHVPLPEDPLTPGDLDGLRFDTAMRGYRMSQVDAVIDRLRREIRDLDDELARMRGRPSAGAGAAAADGAVTADGTTAADGSATTDRTASVDSPSTNRARPQHTPTSTAGPTASIASPAASTSTTRSS